MKAINWCEIYVDGKISCKHLEQYVIEQSSAVVKHCTRNSRWSLDHPVADISVEINEDYDCRMKSRVSDGFLFFPLKITAEQKNDIGTEEYELLIADIVRGCRALGLTCELVADFEV